MKKGMMGIEATFLGLAFLMVVGAIAGTPSFRHRRALEMCGNAPGCVERINAMSKTELLDYISDKRPGSRYYYRHLND